MFDKQETLEMRIHDLAMRIQENKDDSTLIPLVNNYKELLGHYKIYLHDRYVKPKEDFLKTLYDKKQLEIPWYDKPLK